MVNGSVDEKDERTILQSSFRPRLCGTFHEGRRMHDTMALSCVETESFKRPGWVHDYLRQQFPEHDVSERERFVFRREFVEMIGRHHKCTTIRYTKDTIEYPACSILPVFVSDDGFSSASLSLKGCVEVSVVCYKKFGALSDQDALMDGFDSLNDLRDTLSQIYGPIGKDEILSIFGIKAENFSA